MVFRGTLVTGGSGLAVVVVALLGLLDSGVVGAAATGPLLVNESIKVARGSAALAERIRRRTCLRRSF